jgi:hypothetical protein
VYSNSPQLIAYEINWKGALCDQLISEIDRRSWHIPCSRVCPRRHALVEPYLCFYMLYKLDNSKIYSTTNCSVIKEFRQKRLYSTIHTQKRANPYWVTGFADAESSFSIRVGKDESRFKSLRIAPIFSIELHEKDPIFF